MQATSELTLEDYFDAVTARTKSALIVYRLLDYGCIYSPSHSRKDIVAGFVFFCMHTALPYLTLNQKLEIKVSVSDYALMNGQSLFLVERGVGLAWTGIQTVVRCMEALSTTPGDS